MQRKLLFSISFIFPILCFSQETTKKQVHFYHTGVVQQEYFVLKRNQHFRHGPYKAFHANGRIRETGAYKNNIKDGEWKIYSEDGRLKQITVYQDGKKISDKKVGVWLEYFERGQVVKGFDYDQNQPVPTQIFVRPVYPPLSRELGIEGTVEVYLKLDENCDIEIIRIQHSVAKDCDEESIKAVKRWVELSKKYLPEECKGLEKVIPMTFRLE